MPGHTSLSYGKSMVKPQPPSGLHFESDLLTPSGEGETSSGCPVTCLMPSFELSPEAWDWKTLCVVEEGIDTDTSVVALESKSN